MCHVGNIMGKLENWNYEEEEKFNHHFATGRKQDTVSDIRKTSLRSASSGLAQVALTFARDKIPALERGSRGMKLPGRGMR
jgi:hypothetical protein